MLIEVKAKMKIGITERKYLKTEKGGKGDC